VIRVVQAVLYDDEAHVRFVLTNEDPAGGWTLTELAALVAHVIPEGSTP
jgi:hypothetical protein